jgi:pimeloyl-ACP methyl ester carboxylesterase
MSALDGPAGELIELERGEIKIACRDFGGTGPAVLLVHGLAGHSGEWRQTASWLTRSNRVLALDARGHGRSTRLPADVSPEAHVADVAFAIEQLKLEPVVLAGQSLGANVSFLTAARHPEVVAGLIVAEGCPEADPEGTGAEQIRRWLDSWPVPFSSALAAIEHFGGPSLYAEAWADGLEQRDDGLWPCFDASVMVRTLREGTREEHWAEWGQISCPTLVVRAGEGFFPAALLEDMAARLPDGRYAEIPGAKHDLHLDKPDAWREVLATFVAQLDGGTL